MTYYPDLSECTGYWPSDRLLAVGWLEAEHPFETGQVDPSLVNRLQKFLRNPWQPKYSMGRHDCALCAKANGSAQIFVAGTGGVYVAPLILHYIQKHHYFPPQEFQEAVMTSPLPNRPGYFQALRASGADPVAMSMPAPQTWERMAPEWGMSLQQVEARMAARAKELRAEYFTDESEAIEPGS